MGLTHAHTHKHTISYNYVINNIMPRRQKHIIHSISHPEFTLCHGLMVWEFFSSSISSSIHRISELGLENLESFSLPAKLYPRRAPVGNGARGGENCTWPIVDKPRCIALNRVGIREHVCSSNLVGYSPLAGKQPNDLS